MFQVQTPDDLYDELFVAVQTARVFADSKTFVDSIPKRHPDAVLNTYRRERYNLGFDLAAFVEQNFWLPDVAETVFDADKQQPVREHIEKLWDLLRREADTAQQHSSLLSLPRPYIVPGGRFREIYYWDSYFTMLGLASAGRVAMLTDMVTNFAHLIDEIGFIPNGNRSYFCSRSQPPVFAMMVELLADTRNDCTVYAQYLPQLEQEYAFWMSGSEQLDSDQTAVRRVIRHNGGFLNRYWDDSDQPRQESYLEDIELAARSDRPAAELYRDLRAAAESGWDFSSRWFEDATDLASVRTTAIVPVDLNALLYKLESVLAKIAALIENNAKADFYRHRAATRKTLIQSLFFDAEQGLFGDLLLPDLLPSHRPSLATAYPLWFALATPDQARQVAEQLRTKFLKAGGWVTTLNCSGQQWDAPNGWAPTQWIVYRSLCRYGYEKDARAGVRRWVANNLAVYRSTGNLQEKYDVERVGVSAGGGEYAVQTGFGWTNGVLLTLLDALAMK